MSQEITPANNDFSLPALKSSTRFYDYLKFKTGHLYVNDVLVSPDIVYLVLKLVELGRMFHVDGGPPETCEVSEIDEMNSHVLKEDWPEDLNGNQEPPWKTWIDIYLVKHDDNSPFMFSNCTNGHFRAAGKLSNQVESQRARFGPNVLPLVKIGSATMRNQYHTLYPHFEIVGWEGMPDKPRTASEICNDSLPNHATKGKPWDDGVDF